MYHLPYLQDQVNSTHDLLVNTENKVQSNILAYNAQLDKYKFLLANNSVLIYACTVVQMNDSELSDFTTETDVLEPSVEGDTTLNTLGSAIELIGAVLVLKFVCNVGKLVKQCILDSDEESVEVADENLFGAEAEGVMDVSEDSIHSGLVSKSESASTESLEGFGEDIGVYSNAVQLAYADCIGHDLLEPIEGHAL